MKILIIDNEIEVRNTLFEMVKKWCNDKHEIEEANGVNTGLLAIEHFKPDVVLLDVEMDDGSGFDLLKKLSNPTFQLIFTTAHSQYAIQAIRFSALDYLLKPIDPIDLHYALGKASQEVRNLELHLQLKVLMQQVENKVDVEKQIVLKDIDKTYFIKLSDILFCEAEGSYTKFYLSNIDPILISKNLRSFEEVLAPAGLIRTHHSCLVNPKKIKIFDRKADHGTLILEGGHTVPVSQRKKNFVIQFLENR
jgi:two-component system, LytTR family, response regulator